MNLPMPFLDPLLHPDSTATAVEALLSLNPRNENDTHVRNQPSIGGHWDFGADIGQDAEVSGLTEETRGIYMSTGHYGTQDERPPSFLPDWFSEENTGENEDVSQGFQGHAPDASSNFSEPNKNALSAALLQRITAEDELERLGVAPEIPSIVNPYGHILGQVPEQIPTMEDPDFIISPGEYAVNLPALHETLNPPSFTSPPPDNYVYPCSPTWTKNPDKHYTSGVCYATHVSTNYSRLSQEAVEQASLTTHPTVDPVFDPVQKVYVDRTPEGMVQMRAGIPHHLDIAELNASKTYACYHTLSSIQSMYPLIYPRVLCLSEKLRLLVFGRPRSAPEVDDHIQPLFTFPFFRHNLRSKKRGATNQFGLQTTINYDGSYSLASTMEEGNAFGTLVPATQAAYPAARKRIEEVLKIIQELYQLLGPRSMSAFEWKITQFHLEDNNVFGFAGLKHGGISVQFNVSSGFNGGDLVKEIALQGTWHIDDKDAITIMTLFIMIVMLPPGMFPFEIWLQLQITFLFSKDAHEGSFLLGRYGLYMHEAGAWIVFIFFNGRDMHSGRQVSIEESLRQDERVIAMNELWQKAGEVNRVGIPVYFPSQAVHRTGGISVTPATTFTNHGSLTRSSAQSLNYVQHGNHLLGPAHDRNSRLAREAVSGMFNFLKQAGLRMNEHSASSLLELIEYPDPDKPGNWKTVEAPALDALNPLQAPSVQRYRGYYAYYHRIASSLDLQLSRAKHRSTQKQLEQPRVAPSERPILISKLLPVTLSQQLSYTSEDFSSNPFTHPVSEAAADISPLSSSLSSLPRSRSDSVSFEPDTIPAAAGAGSKRKHQTGPHSPTFHVGAQVYGDFELQDIVGHRFKQGIAEYRVRFAGYNSDADEYYPELELESAQLLLDNYKQQHPELTMQSLPPSEDPATLKRLEKLQPWLDRESLQIEHDSLVQRFDNLEKTKDFYRHLGKTVQTWASDFLTVTASQTKLTGFLLCSPLDAPDLPGQEYEASPQGRSVDVLLQRAVDAAKLYPKAIQSGLVLDILQASVRWQECRSLIILSDFLMDGLPKLLKILIHAFHQESNFLEIHYPSFARLVTEVYKYLTSWRAQYRKKTPGPEPAQGLEIPWNLYGLRACSLTSSSSELLPVTITWSKPIKNGSLYLDEAVGQCLETILIDELVLPHLRTATSRDLTTSRRKKARDKQAQAAPNRRELLERCQLRGIILQCLVDEVNESILVTKGITQILESPISLFPEFKEETRLLSRLKGCREETLAPLRRWLASNVHSEVCVISDDIAHFVNHRMAEFCYGKSIPLKAWDRASTHSDATEIPFERPATRRATQDDHALSADDLMDSTHENIPLGLLGLIFREALGERRQLPSPIHPLRFLLEGKDPGSGKPNAAFGDRDQFDPVRTSNRGAQLLKEHLPGNKLTTSAGLSNLLVWMGTGQGNKTSKFLCAFDRVFSYSLQECVALFGAALIHNQSVLSRYFRDVDDCLSADTESAPPHIDGLLQISNSRIYGSACNTLKLLPTVREKISPGAPVYKKILPSDAPVNKMDLNDKMEPYWTWSVRQQWIAHLGDMLNADPSTYMGKRQSWSSTIHMLIDLKIPGFMSGLTVMQTANALAISGIIEPPELTELADWIWQNHRLGAFAGLQRLGFCLPNRKAVYVALTCLYTFLDNHLTDDDKTILGFGTIGLEHALCKVSRWSKKVEDILRWAKAAEQSDTFIHGANLHNPAGFPFPLSGISRQIIQETLIAVEDEYNNQKQGR
ncbi:hypothetical protein Hypma_007527 [Hypsizygus marmoreus]|uniref:Chromo domain-containing protein n=1 Tax=Hypsizygus marmoreus TaxID=39966 RepID=A0A369JTG1_HYPMA|nr:hypothetical protein Hypma_007527 [Hypsizygus marmoreus]